MNSLTRRRFFQSLAAVAVVAAVPLPIGLKTPLSVLKVRADEWLMYVIVTGTDWNSKTVREVIGLPFLGDMEVGTKVTKFREITSIQVLDEHANAS